LAFRPFESADKRSDLPDARFPLTKVVVAHLGRRYNFLPRTYNAVSKLSML